VEAAAPLTPLEVPAAHDVCVDRIVRAIHLGAFSAGDRLPSERELAVRLGVSRVTLREALARLEGAGYVVRTRGPRGGTVVASPDEATVRARLVANAGQLAQVAELRAAIEGAAARLAAERAGRAELRSLRRAFEELGDDDRRLFRRADTAFHLEIARASGNPALVDATADVRERMFSLGDLLRYDVRLETTRTGHAAILAAIVDGDGEAARAAMEEHVATAQRELRGILRS
jgi:DNA-binding FadR family transcriptional regulator